MNFRKFLFKNNRRWFVFIFTLVWILFGFVSGTWKQLFLLTVWDKIVGQVVDVKITIRTEKADNWAKSKTAMYQPTIQYKCWWWEFRYTPNYSTSESFQQWQNVSLLHKNCSYISIKQKNSMLIFLTSFFWLFIMVWPFMWWRYLKLYKKLEKFSKYGSQFKARVSDIVDSGYVAMMKPWYYIYATYMWVTYKSEPIFEPKSILELIQEVTIISDINNQEDYVVVRQEVFDPNYLTHIQWIKSNTTTKQSPWGMVGLVIIISIVFGIFFYIWNEPIIEEVKQWNYNQPEKSIPINNISSSKSKDLTELYNELSEWNDWNNTSWDFLSKNMRLYIWKTTTPIEQNLSEWLVVYKWKQYTFVRWTWWINEAYQNMWVPVFDVEDREQATLYLKYVFSRHKERYPLIYEQKNWWDLSHQELYHIISQWVEENNIPHLGWQNVNWGEPNMWANMVMWRLPIRINGNFVNFTMYGNDRQAYFYSDYNIDAAIVVAPILEQ